MHLGVMKFALPATKNKCEWEWVSGEERKKEAEKEMEGCE